MPSAVSFLEKLKDATIGFSGYARLGRDPRGGFGYMAALLAIVIAINGYITMVQMRRDLAELARQVATWPDFGIRDGQFSFAGPMPYTQTLADGTLLVIDTTGQTSPQSLAGRQAYLIARDKLYTIRPGAPPQELSFAMLGSDLSKESLLQFLGSRPERLLPVVYLFVYLFQLLFKAVDGTILALIALLYGARFGRRIPFELGFKLGLYAMTLPVIIQWVIADFHTFTAFGFTLWWSLAAIYLIFGLRAYLTSLESQGPTGVR